ncbi:hypothetical protein WH95_18540 [Kiloniella litopenaei]|uniref:Phage capsid-like C-terminal domain-containing protein n=1 Tax=Kiloniella litopenaei TaxID=1549748 RepID=A0A0M2R613_9PROT|nr:phage major capsid protein [Kiloniella litopenaei]KKJ75440.1 hypothetical protein WH95_18540 [Kiloniella litopenaei]
MKTLDKTRGPRGFMAVRADATDPKAAVEAVQKAFAEFKATNEEIIKAEVKKGVADVIDVEKLDRINAALNELQATVDENAKKMAALQFDPVRDQEEIAPEVKAYNDKFNDWFRNGGEALEKELKAANRPGGVMAPLAATNDVERGLTAPVEWDRQITDKLKDASEMRMYATAVPVTGAGFKHLYNLRGTSSGWVGETEQRDATHGSAFADYEFSFGEVYANPAATDYVLEDSETDIAAWISSEIEDEFATQEGIAFVSGDGVKKPKGITQYTSTIEGALAAADRHPLGPIAEVNSGHASQITADGLISLKYAISTRRTSRDTGYFANRNTIAAIRKLKDGDGNYLWQPSYAADRPQTVAGQAMRELSGLPDIAANAIPVLYGDMKQTYRIFDRRGVRLLRDPYTNKPYTMFYTTKRVGGGLWNPEWMRYHKIAA